jgi:hypothetical protein
MGKGKGKRKEDTLDRVILHPDYYIAWLQKAYEASCAAAREKVDPDSIPDEMATEQTDGSVLIWVDIPKVGRVEMLVPRGMWKWMT